MALPRVLLIRSTMLDDRLERKTWEISMKKLIVNPTTIENKRDLINDAFLWVIYMKRKNPRGINPSRLIVISKRLFRNLLCPFNGNSKTALPYGIKRLGTIKVAVVPVP